ncbi:glycosyltransferase family protein [Afifella pfennigii]|uniref:glycosyltransferase family protein n=1 Tax=Afifella pfennigii TaxID=209897 RepID=UPI000479B916|nr:glycosyltransferase [Afifella pfennigii]
MRALIWAQNLLGTGHAVRAGAIAQALSRTGAEVTLVTGSPLPASMRTEHIDIVTLPAARAADTSFSAILDERGERVDEAWWARRRDILLQAARQAKPDILLTEAFPLARRAFSAELLPLIAACRELCDRCFIAASIRDILVRKPAAKEAAMADLALAHYDAILVHADPALVRLEASFGAAERLAPLIHYTGYIANGASAKAEPGLGENEVIVSAGGGAVGRKILAAALQARAFSGEAGKLTWRILAGANLPQSDFARLAEAAPAGIIVERARPDFPELLNRARLSVSQAGYNTVVDILAAGVPAVVVPFAEGSETEQTQRAALLTDKGLAVALTEAELSPSRLARAVDAAMALTPETASIRLGGAQETARLLVQAAGGRP